MTGLTTYVVANMPGSAASGWSADMLSSVACQSSLDGCNGFTADQVGNITTAAFSGWTWGCLSWLTSSAFSKVTAQQLAALSEEAVGG